MLIQEVTTQKPQKPLSPQQQRVAALKTQLAQAREVAQRQALAARQARLNRARAALNRGSTAP